MARTLKLEVANFTCLFGEDKKLLDFLDAIVFPAFLNPGWRRKYGKTTYMFYEPQLVVLDEDDASSLAIVGRLNSGIALLYRPNPRLSEGLNSGSIVEGRWADGKGKASDQ